MKFDGASLPDMENILELALEPYSDEFTIESSINLEEDFLDRKWGQYNAQKILYELHELKQRSGWDKVLGITRKDIFVEGMNYVFGLASPSGGVCLVSLHRVIRLKQKLTQLEKTRIVKEITHEIGHVYGLQHCTTRNCVMTFSNSLSDIDAKSADLCEKCKRILIAKNY